MMKSPAARSVFWTNQFLYCPGTSGGAGNRTMAPAATQKIKPSMSSSPGERLHSCEVGPYNTGGSSEPSKKSNAISIGCDHDWKGGQNTWLSGCGAAVQPR